MRRSSTRRSVAPLLRDWVTPLEERRLTCCRAAPVRQGDYDQVRPVMRTRRAVSGADVESAFAADPATPEVDAEIAATPPTALAARARIRRIRRGDDTAFVIGPMRQLAFAFSPRIDGADRRHRGDVLSDRVITKMIGNHEVFDY